MFLRFPWLISRRRLLIAVLIDSALFSLLYPLAFHYRFGSWPGFSLPLTWLLEVWLLASYVLGRYHSHRESSWARAVDQLSRSLAALLLCMGLYLAYYWLTATAFGAEDSRGFLLPVLLGFAALSSLSQAVLAAIVQGGQKATHQWLLLGSPDLASELQRQLAWSRLRVDVGHCDSPSLVNSASSASGVVVANFQALDSHQLQQLLLLQNGGLPVLSLLGWSERVLQRFPPELLNPADLLRGDFTIPQGSIQLRLKRLGDVLLSAVLLVLALPLLGLACLLIWLEDRGPVLYSQLRSGLGGNPYRVWKLRSMRVDAERHGAQWVGQRDSRITRIGRVLRLTRIDELPQLLAVLTGEMSLIGPRPERPEFEAELERQIPHYRLRHWMRPGLSGWAQVNYPYGASVEDAANKLSYDLYYLRNFSFWLDLLILFKTMRLVFNAQGAIPQTL